MVPRAPPAMPPPPPMPPPPVVEPVRMPMHVMVEKGFVPPLPFHIFNLSQMDEIKNLTVQYCDDSELLREKILEFIQKKLPNPCVKWECPSPIPERVTPPEHEPKVFPLEKCKHVPITPEMIKEEVERCKAMVLPECEFSEERCEKIGLRAKEDCVARHNLTQKCIRAMCELKLEYMKTVPEEVTPIETLEKCIEMTTHATKEMIEDCEEVKKHAEKECKKRGEFARKQCELAREYLLPKHEELCERIEEEWKACLELPEKIYEHLVDRLEKICELREYEIKIEPSAEVLPVLIALKLPTSQQIEEIKALVVELGESFEIAGLTIYKAWVSATKLDDLKQLQFVVDVKVEPRVLVKPKVKKEFYVVNVTEDIKNLEIAKQLVPEHVKPLIEEHKLKIVGIGEKLEKFKFKVEKRGIGYKIKWFFGLASKEEMEDAELLKKQVKELNQTLEELKMITSSTSDVSAVAVLVKEVNKLKVDLKELEERAKEIREKARGLVDLILSVFRR
jgi:hypothetical protein